MENENIKEPENSALQQADVMPSLFVKELTGCGVCGSELVYIRGKYPNTDKRKICPTCAYERLEQINEISNKDYGKAYQSNGA